MSHNTSTLVTLDSLTYEVEGNYCAAESHDEPESFKIERIYCDLITREPPKEETTVEVTAVICKSIREAIQKKIDLNLSVFHDHFS